ncbi:MAG: SUMF1/EgtB/PvdO family nonheme iron enzyme, partial [Acidobacteria bacterium]|nr:SUMF1/EgtB/PvdO family nonheme iron enzyme [Acidobacteriota bacterium]
MYTKALSALTCLLLLALIGGCAKKEEAVSTETAAEPAAAKITPGEMVLIPAGEFTLGSTDKDKSSWPEQKVNLPAFWIDKYEVTNKEFLDFSVN